MVTRAVLCAFLAVGMASAASTPGRDGVAVYKPLPGLNFAVLATAPDGSVVVGGSAVATGLPVTDNAVQKTYRGAVCYEGGVRYPQYPCSDGYVARFAPDGTLLYGSYIWGGGDVKVAAVTVGAGGTVYAAINADLGVVGIPNPPSLDGAPNAYIVGLDAAQPGFTVVFPVTAAPRMTIARLTAEAAGNLYVAGSCNIGTLVATPGAFQPQASGPGQAGCVLSFAPSTASLRYATYLGDSQTAIKDLAVDDQGNAYVAGSTLAANLAGVERGWTGITAGVLSPTGSYGFVSVLDPAGSSVLWSSIFGSPTSGGATQLLRNSRGDVAVIGIAEMSPQFTFNADLSPVRPVSIVKFAGNPRQPVYSVQAAAGADIATVSAALADDGSVLLTGMTKFLQAGGLDSPLLPTTADALERCVSGQRSRFLERLAPADGHVEYASYFTADQQAVTASPVAPGPGDAAYLLLNGVSALDLTYYGGPSLDIPLGGAVLLALTPGSAPAGARLCAVNAANMRPDALAAGAVVALFGTALGPAGVTAGEPDAQGNYPTELGGTSVLLDGTPLPLLAVSPSQINTLAPSSVPSSGRFEVRASGSSQFLSVQFRPSAPALFARLGLVAAVAYNADGTPNGPDNPAARGSVVKVYGTGFGAPTQLPEAFIGNQAVPVASAAGEPPGVIVLGLTVPQYLPPAYQQVAPISFQPGYLILDTGLFIWVR